MTESEPQAAVLTAAQLRGMLPDGPVGAFDELYRIADTLGAYQLQTLVLPAEMEAGWRMFLEGMLDFLFTMPVGDGRNFAEIPGIVRAVRLTPPQDFADWVLSFPTLEDEMSTGIIRQIVLRNLHHFIEFCMRNRGGLYQSILDEVRAEFEVFKPGMEGEWMWRFTEGFYSSAVETFVALVVLPPLVGWSAPSELPVE